MYGKLYESTFTGSMLGAGSDVFAVWGYIIAHARAGMVEVNPALCAFSLGCSVENVDSALAKLQEPDPKSRSKEEEGRRIVRTGEFSFRVVNHKHYRDLRTSEDRREYMRIKQRESRARRKAAAGAGGVKGASMASTLDVKESTKTKAKTEADQDPSDPCQTALLSDEFMAGQDFVRGVWEYFCTKRREAYPDSRALKLTPTRRGHIRARLMDRSRGTLEKARARELCLVVKKFFDPRYFWALNGHNTPELVFRSAEQLEKVRDAKPYGQNVTPIMPPPKPTANEDPDKLYQQQLKHERGPRKVGPTAEQLKGFDPEAARAKIEAELAAQEAAG